jgi:hypothetical protein
MDHAENTASIVKEACLLIRCLSTDVLLLRVLAPAGMCLVMGILSMPERHYSQPVTSCAKMLMPLSGLSLRTLRCYESQQSVYRVTIREAAIWGSKLIKISRGFLESKYKVQIPLERLRERSASDA